MKYLRSDSNVITIHSSKVILMHALCNECLLHDFSQFLCVFDMDFVALSFGNIYLYVFSLFRHA